MPGQFKKMWKKVGNQWLRTHVAWLRAGDLFQIEGDTRAFMTTSNPHEDARGIPTVNRVEAEIADEHKHHS